MLLGILILLLGLGIISTMLLQSAGAPLSFIFGSLTSNTLHLINYIAYALMLLGLIVGLVGYFGRR